MYPCSGSGTGNIHQNHPFGNHPLANPRVREVSAGGGFLFWAGGDRSLHWAVPSPAIVAECSATLASVAAAPTCSTSPFDRQLDLRLLQPWGLEIDLRQARWGP